jgi:hypothetical protein
MKRYTLRLVGTRCPKSHPRTPVKVGSPECKRCAVAGKVLGEYLVCRSQDANA